MTKALNYKSIPKLIAANGKGVRRAGMRTLNTIAFDSLPQLVNDGKRDIDFDKNARRALGWRVTKASTKDLKAEVWTNRGWLVYHLEEGKREATSGWVHKGRKYILVPRESVRDRFFTKRGRIRTPIRRNMFIAMQNSDFGYVIYRKPRTNKTVLIATLNTSVDQHEDLTPEHTINRVFKGKANRLMNFYLDAEAKRNMLRG